MNARLGTREREAVTISESALVTTGSNHHVFVVEGGEGDGRVVRVPVTIGERTVGRVEILSGLTPGQRVITHGLQKVRPGEPVRDRKSTRLNSSHVAISYAVFCLKKKTE